MATNMTSLRSAPVTAKSLVATDGYPLALDNLQGIDYAAALFVHSARLYPFAPGYLQAQLNELIGPCRRAQLNHLALSCYLLAQQLQQPDKTPRAALAMLASHAQYQQAAEYIGRALINHRYLQHQRHAADSLSPQEAQEDAATWALPFALHDDIRPVPASLTRALLQWPDDDKLLAQALSILHRQPALASLVCRYATAYTPQGRQLDLKPSLLLLGPQRSRELVLLAHFESNLSKPVFPLRAPILKRRALIQHMLQRLAQTFAVPLPGRAELIAYLLVYDAWRSPGWTSRSQFQADPQQQPWRVDSWLSNTRPANHRVALRLCQYWHMPAALGDAIQLRHANPKVNALLALSIASVHVLNTAAYIHAGNGDNHQLDSKLSPWLDALTEPSATPAAERYLQALTVAATDAGFSSDLANSMRP